MIFSKSLQSNGQSLFMVMDRFIVLPLSSPGYTEVIKTYRDLRMIFPK